MSICFKQQRVLCCSKTKYVPLSRGFTLIEVLITLLILSIGFLGIAGVQSLSLQQAHNTYFRTQADLLLRDMADRMRNNAEGASLGLYVHEGGASGGNAAACSGSAALCSVDQMAVADLAEWTDRVSSFDVLPDGKATIAVLDIPGAYLITISWRSKKTVQDIEEASGDDECIGGEINQRSCLALRVLIAS